MHKPILIIAFILFTAALSSCSMQEIEKSRPDLSATAATMGSMNNANTEIYKNEKYNIDFSYPSNFQVSTHLEVVSWNASGAVDQREEYVVFSGANGNITLTLPGDSIIVGGAPLFGVKTDKIQIGTKEVTKTLAFGSQDSPGEDQKGIWTVDYSFMDNNKTYRFGISGNETSFSQYNIPNNLEQAIVSMISTFK